MSERSLSTALGNSLTEEAATVSSELLEVGLDAILEDGLLKDIPLLSTAVSIYKIGNSIKERHNIKKLNSFLNELNNGIVDDFQREEYIRDFVENKKIRNKELEYILVLIERYLSEDRSRLLAKLYLAYLENRIVWDEFVMYAEILDRLFKLDIDTLVSDADQYIVYKNIGAESILRLVALGLMVDATDTSPFEQRSNGNFSFTTVGLNRAVSTDKVYMRTEFGEKLAEILR